MYAHFLGGNLEKLFPETQRFKAKYYVKIRGKKRNKYGSKGRN